MRGFTDEKKEECCGTCAWHQHEDISDGWVCTNRGSIYHADETDYSEYCTEYEAR